MRDIADMRKARFVEDLLAHMTLSEKLGQLRLLRIDPSGHSERSALEDHISNLIRAGNVSGIEGIADARQAMTLQRCAVEQSRYGVPLLLSGDRSAQTFWPDPWVLAATWNEEVVSQFAQALAMSGRTKGRNWIATPVVQTASTTQQSTSQDRPVTMAASPYLARRTVGALLDGLTKALPDGDCPSLPLLRMARRDDAEIDRLRSVTASSDFAFSVDICGTEEPKQGSTRHAPLGKGTVEGIDLAKWQTISATTSANSIETMQATQLAALEQNSAARSALDEAVRKVLWTKVGMGLLRDPYAGFVQTEASMKKLALIRATARSRVARSAAVLLRNDDALLPLTFESGRVLVSGADAGDVGTVSKGLAEFGIDHRAVTGLAMRSDGQEHQEPHPADGLAIGLACDAASRSGTVLAVIGNHDYLPDDDGAAPKLSEPVRSMLRGLALANRRIVLVELTDRPVDLGELASHFPGRLLAWNDMSGRESALGELLAGDGVPTGRLPFPIESERPDAAYSFGHGLGYSPVAYTAMEAQLGADRLWVQITLQNRGVHEAVETAQLYIRRPDAEPGSQPDLAAYRRVTLDAGSQATLRFDLGIEQLGELRADGRHVAMEGEYEFFVGPNAADTESACIALHGSMIRVMAMAGLNRATAREGSQRSA